MPETVIERIKVDYDDEKGPITLEIRPGHMTLGHYARQFKSPSGTTQYPQGSLTDNIPDVHILPEDGIELSRCKLYMVGSYAPAANSDTGAVSVEYIFRQEGEIISSVKIQKTTDLVTSNHTFKFRMQ